MVLITLNISEEMKERLKLEDNQSKLVNDLLIDYFATSNDIEERLKAIQDRKEAYLKTLEVQEEKLKDKYKVEVEKKRVEEEIQELKENKQEEIINNCITNCKNVFNVDITREQAEEFLNDERYSALEDYLVDKMLIEDKEDKDDNSIN